MDIKEKGKIICGFAGIGKSYLARNSNYVDLESTPFNKNWDIYSNVAIHMSNNGYNVMLSCHKELRDILKRKLVNYIVAIPKKEMKAEYIKRYKSRKNTDQFIKLFEDNFEKFIEEIENEETNILYIENYLSDSLEVSNNE